jgi:hypothetical protein
MSGLAPANSALLLEVDAHVEAIVIPIRVVFAAPTAVVIHASYIFVDLRPVIAVPRGVMVDSGAVRLQAPLAIGPAVTERGLACRQREHDYQSSTQNYANDLRFHPVPPHRQV